MAGKHKAGPLAMTTKMLVALDKASGFGLYHEFSNTSTINALRRRGMIQSDRFVGWYCATDKGRAALARATAPTQEKADG